ncbi:unnamed protein product [Auanema sp. JU1783]|nr:unnamed protein product [Auanema sp. JU1783]
MDSEESLKSMLEQRLRTARSLDEQLMNDKLSKLQGVPKLRNRLASEIRFLQSLEEGKCPLEKKYIETSNVTHFENVVKAIDEFPEVKAVFNTYSILDPSSNETLKHTVDLVAKNGEQWVKIISRSARGICMDWLASSNRNIFEQADNYCYMANLFKKNFTPPEVVFQFVSGVPDRIAQKLISMKVSVLGEQIPMNQIANIPEDFLEMLEPDESDSETEQGDRTASPPINLDVSAVFVLVSNLTHSKGTEHKFNSTLLTSQAEMERKKPARVELLNLMKDRELLICQTAHDSVLNIMKTVAGDSERARLTELFTKVRVVEDKMSERTMALKKSERINERSMIIFGSGDSYRAVTATANKHFVSSAFHQGVSFDVILHESRALSEQKELPL